MNIRVDEQGLSELKMILASSATNVCATMSSMYKCCVSCDSPSIEFWQWPDLPDTEHHLDEDMEGFIVRYSGGMNGNALFMFSEPGKALLSETMNASPALFRASPELFYRSMLTETAHIVMTSYLNHFTAGMNMQISQGPPIYLHDNGEKLWKLAMLESIQQSRRALFWYLRYTAQDGETLGHFFVVPSPSCWQVDEKQAVDQMATS